MGFDAHKNLAYSTVATAPSPASSGTSLVVQAGDGAKFPAVPFNATVWPTGANPLTSNAEIVRVTTISTDTFTITRTQESTSARSIVVGDQIAATITAKTLTDVEQLAVVTKNSAASPYTLTAADDLVLYDASGGASTATLPTAAGITGRIFSIKRTDNTPSIILTINTTSAQTIDGASSLSVTTQNDTVTVVSDGSNWRLI